MITRKPDWINLQQKGNRSTGFTHWQWENKPITSWMQKGKNKQSWEGGPQHESKDTQRESSRFIFEIRCNQGCLLRCSYSFCPGLTMLASNKVSLRSGKAAVPLWPQTRERREAWLIMLPLWTVDGIGIFYFTKWAFPYITNKSR